MFSTLLLSADSGLRPFGLDRPSGFAGRVPTPAASLKGVYGQLPLYFEPNVGQFDTQVRYVTRGGGYTLFLTDTEAVMVLSRTQGPPREPRHRPEEPSRVERTVVRMRLVGARQPAQWESLEKQPGISNYFIGNDPNKWRTDVANYSRVAARGIYRGIDLVCYGNQRQLEYDLEVAPGSDPRQVQLAWEGVESLRLNEEGDLVLATRLGDVVQKRPRVYQEQGGQRVEVASKYVLAHGNRVRFELVRYDRHRRLLIDPVVLVYSTYLGGSGDDVAYGIAVDSAGSAYVTGYTTSANFPTSSPYQPTYQGGWDAFVTKLASAGNTLVYSTYLAGGNTNGSDTDYGTGIAVDAANSAYVTGCTNSSSFPTKSAYQTTYRGGGSCDAFVTKLAPAGNALVYSTYLGGSDEDDSYGIAVDSGGSAYVTGNTKSTDFPTQSPYQTTYQGGTSDGFVTKLAPAGNALVYSTYLGGSGSDYPFGIAVDAAGSAYVSGYTNSANFPTQSAYQTALRGKANVIVTKLTPAGNALVYSTYLGGSNIENGRAIAVDAAGAAYVTGCTTSTDFPTQAAYQSAYRGGGSCNAFVTKLASAGNALVYSTYLGGTGADEGYGIAVDTAGFAYVAGITKSTDFPTQSPYETYQGNHDAFVAKLTPTGNALLYSTYLGGSGDDCGNAIAVDAAGAAYVTGYTTSSNFPTLSPYQGAYQGGTYDVLVAKLSGPPGTFALLAPANGSTGVPTSPTLSWGSSSGATSYDVYFGASSSPPFVTNTTATSYAPGILGPGTTYYWQVVAKNSAGSASSAMWSFTTGAVVQSAPAIYTFTGTVSGTLNGAPFSNATMTITVTGNTSNVINGGGGHYELDHAANTATFTISGVGSGTLGNSGSVDDNQIPFGGSVGLYDNSKSWLVLIEDNIIGGTAFASYTLTTSIGPTAPQASNPSLPDFVSVPTSVGNLTISSESNVIFQARVGPAAPVLVSPANGAVGVSLTPTLTWNASGGAASYDVYFGTSSSSPFVVNTTGTSYAPGTLSGGTTYYWQVVAKNSAGSAGSATSSFTTLVTAPAAPSLTVPANGATGISLTPTLSWNASSGATSYDVYFGTSSSPPLATNTTGATYAPPGTLVPSTTYFWQVVAGNSAGSASSATWSFTTLATAPAAATLFAPLNGATGITQMPTLSWNPSNGATSYDVYFGTSASPPLLANTTGTSYTPGTLGNWTTYYWQIVARNNVGTTASATWSFTTGGPATALHFVPVTPCRVADTRFGSPPFGGPSMGMGETRTFPIPQSGCGIPISAQAYSLNVTVVPKGALSYLTLWPAGQNQPLVSTLNSFGGIVVANAAIVLAGTNGGVNVFVTNPTDVILDINGYFDTSSGTDSYWFYTATPCRVVDTRGRTGQFGGPSMGALESRDYPIPLSGCPIPAVARGYSLNFTVVPSGYLGFLTTWPTGQSQPNVSTLNSWTGKVVANAAIVPAGTNESVSVYVSNPTNVIMDINGYFGQPGSAGALEFYPVTPCRVADTRWATAPFGGPEMEGPATRAFAIPASACNIPSNASAYSLNVTVVPDGYLGYLSAWPAGQSQPVVSTLNSWDGSVTANAAIVPAGTNGAISVYVTDPTHVIVDINGYFAP